MMYSLKKSSSGITLLEVLLAIFILSLLVTIGAPVYRKMLLRNDLSLAVLDTSQALRRAKVLAQTSTQDSAWGVYLAGNQAILFAGNDYASRSTAWDEIIFVPGTVVFSGLDEIVFSKAFGQPSVTGAITVTSADNQSKTITVNAAGTVIY